MYLISFLINKLINDKYIKNYIFLFNLFLIKILYLVLKLNFLNRYKE